MSRGKSNADKERQRPIADPRNVQADTVSSQPSESYRRAMQGQGTGGYGGQYAGMPAGVVDKGEGPVAEEPAALGTVGASGGARSPSATDVARDVELQAAIRREIDALLGTEGAEIKLDVANGEARLDGTVSSASMSAELGDIAARSGALHVVNNIRVRAR
jgi:osmotically-inducible protein OsmY